MLKRFRSAITGQFVKAATAERHPRTTVAEATDDGERALLELLAEFSYTLHQIIRAPHYSHPGKPTVTYYHRPADLHHQAYTLITEARRVLGTATAEFDTEALRRELAGGGFTTIGTPTDPPTSEPPEASGDAT